MPYLRQLRPPTLALLIVALAATLPAPRVPRAQAAVPAQQAAIVAPPQAEASLALGAQADIALQITSAYTQPQELRVYEAHAAAPSARAQASARPTQVPLPAQDERIDPQLRRAAREAGGAPLSFVIYLGDQADLRTAYAEASWAARGRRVYATLRDHAAHSQRELRELLATRGVPFEPLWIVNAIVARGDLADVEAVGAGAEGALVRANRIYALPEQPQTSQAEAAAVTNCNGDRPTSEVCWNLRKIGADRVWQELGVRGEGISVASIDTGVAGEHPALAASYRGARAGAPAVHDYNWYDPRGLAAAPADDQGHGTHTMGTLAGVGLGSPDQPAIGVAPGVRWIAAKGCTGNSCAESDLIKSAQWLLAPTDAAGANPRPDLRPMVVNNSWGTATNREVYAGYVAAWRAAGMFPVFANGNAATSGEGQQCGTVLAPGDYANVVGVGATDAGDSVAWFSLRGPSADGRLKPDFAAPGTNIVSAGRDVSTPGYTRLSGTSMATPHVAGVVALLWSANPALIGDYEATYALLAQSARRIDDARCGGAAPGQPNNIYGNGRVDAYAAVIAARVDLPWAAPQAASLRLEPGETTTLTLTLDARRVPGPGSYQGRLLLGGDLGQPPIEVALRLNVLPVAGQVELEGTLRDALSATPLVGEVEVAGGPRLATDAAGRYRLTLPQGSYELTATARGYLPRAAALALDASAAQDFALTADLPRIEAPSGPLSATVGLLGATVLSITLRNSGTQPLLYTPSISDSSGLARLLSAAGTLEPGAETPIAVELHPYPVGRQASASGCARAELRQVSLRLSSNDPRQSQATIALVVTRQLPNRCLFMPTLIQ